jgi:hypothetical protein
MTTLNSTAPLEIARPAFEYLVSQSLITADEFLKAQTNAEWAHGRLLQTPGQALGWMLSRRLVSSRNLKLRAEAIVAPADGIEKERLKQTLDEAYGFIDDDAWLKRALDELPEPIDWSKQWKRVLSNPAKLVDEFRIQKEEGKTIRIAEKFDIWLRRQQITDGVDEAALLVLLDNGLITPEIHESARAKLSSPRDWFAAPSSPPAALVWLIHEVELMRKSELQAMTDRIFMEPESASQAQRELIVVDAIQALSKLEADTSNATEYIQSRQLAFFQKYPALVWIFIFAMLLLILHDFGEILRLTR